MYYVVCYVIVFTSEHFLCHVSSGLLLICTHLRRPVMRRVDSGS